MLIDTSVGSHLTKLALNGYDCYHVDIRLSICHDDISPPRSLDRTTTKESKGTTQSTHKHRPVPTAKNILRTVNHPCERGPLSSSDHANERCQDFSVITVTPISPTIVQLDANSRGGDGSFVRILKYFMRSIWMSGDVVQMVCVGM